MGALTIDREGHVAVVTLRTLQRPTRVQELDSRACRASEVTVESGYRSAAKKTEVYLLQFLCRLSQ